MRWVLDFNKIAAGKFFSIECFLSIMDLAGKYIQDFTGLIKFISIINKYV